MIGQFKCLKTGCDLSCDGLSWHGDLFGNGDVVLFRSCGRNPHGYEWNHVTAEEVDQLGDYEDSCDFLVKKVSSVSDDFRASLLKYQDAATCGMFGVEKGY